MRNKNMHNWDNQLYFTNRRLKITGHIFEFATYSRGIMLGKRFSRIKEEKDKEKEKADTLENRKKSMYRAKKRLIDLVNSNVYQYTDDHGRIFNPVFLSLTFRANIQDLNFANPEFTKFIKRFNYEITGLKTGYLKYVSVVEFQERGAIHYHMIYFNLPFIDRVYDVLADLWTHGSRRLLSVDRAQNVGLYLCKYFTKNILDNRLTARKCYFASRNLIKPTIINIEELVNVIEKKLKFLLPEDFKIYHRSFDCDYLEHVDIDSYNLKKYPDLLKCMKDDIINKYC